MTDLDSSDSPDRVWREDEAEGGLKVGEEEVVIARACTLGFYSSLEPKPAQGEDLPRRWYGKGVITIPVGGTGAA